MRLKELRLERGFSQIEVAHGIKTGQSNIGRWENEEVLPSSDFIIKLADFFEVTTDYLLGRSDELDNVTVQSSVPALPAKERELLTTFRRLSNDYQTLALSTLKNWADMPAQNSTTKRA